MAVSTKLMTTCFLKHQEKENAMKTMRRSAAFLLGSIAIAVSLNALADGDRDDWQGQGEYWREHYRPAPQIEVIVDGLHLGDRERPVESAEDGESGATICHQASGTTWSTREIPCEEPTPPERSRVWSTSPD